MFVKLITNIITRTEKKIERNTHKKQANKLLNYTIMANYNFNPNKKKQFTIRINCKGIENPRKTMRCFNSFKVFNSFFVVVSKSEFLFTPNI